MYVTENRHRIPCKLLFIRLVRRSVNIKRELVKVKYY